MRSKDMAEALQEWAVAALPDLAGSYDHAVSTKTQPLPDVAIEIDDVSVSRSAEGEADATFWAVEQTGVKRWNVKLLLMVAPDPAEAASEQLADFIDDLITSILADGTLGGRVGWVGKDMRGTFTPPFVQFDDNTRGRLATLEIAVYENVSYEEDS